MAHRPKRARLAKGGPLARAEDCGGEFVISFLPKVPFSFCKPRLQCWLAVFDS
jgi:hypothetical protein